MDKVKDGPPVVKFNFPTEITIHLCYELIVHLFSVCFNMFTYLVQTIITWKKTLKRKTCFENVINHIKSWGFISSIESTVLKQHSAVLSCIFIMYFLSFLHFPNQKFIWASSLSVWLWPWGGGGGGGEVHPSLVGQRKWAPLLYDPPPTSAGGWQEESTPSWLPISCLFFYEATQLGGLARLLLLSSSSPSTSLQRYFLVQLKPLPLH